MDLFTNVLIRYRSFCNSCTWFTNPWTRFSFLPCDPWGSFKGMLCQRKLQRKEKIFFRFVLSYLFKRTNARWICHIVHLWKVRLVAGGQVAMPTVNNLLLLKQRVHFFNWRKRYIEIKNSCTKGSCTMMVLWIFYFLVQMSPIARKTVSIFHSKRILRL